MPKITKELIERINNLARKQKTCGLTTQEQAEQQKLRRVYLDCIKDRVKETLDCVKFTDEENEESGSGC